MIGASSGAPGRQTHNRNHAFERSTAIPTPPIRQTTNGLVSLGNHLRSIANTLPLASVLALLTALAGCNGTTPSAHLEDKVPLPVPQATSLSTTPELTPPSALDVPIKLTGETLIHLAFNHQPEIMSSYQQFKAEEARYDFFYASNDQLTPRLSADNTWAESRTTDDEIGERVGERERSHNVEIGVDKQFFDTTRVSVAGGYETTTDDGNFGNQPYVTASLRYPLWESREKLERTSEDIFRQNELNDAQLSYINQVRYKLQQAQNKFYYVVDTRSRLVAAQQYRDDLEALRARLATITDRDISADLSRVEADLARATSEARNLSGLFEIHLARLKYSCGLPYDAEVELAEEPFNPFDGLSHEQVRNASLATDPETATLRNSMRNAEVQLDLARRGKWDVALLLDGKTGFRGRGAETGNTSWEVSAGLAISAVDARVTGSLTRQARASIQRFQQAIAARRSLIYANTLEPLVRIDTLGASRDQLRENLQRYVDDYGAGLDEYFAGTLVIDDLLSRRRTIFDQEVSVSSLNAMVGYNVAELCAATGKYFELLGTRAWPSPAPEETSRGG